MLRLHAEDHGTLWVSSTEGQLPASLLDGFPRGAGSQALLESAQLPSLLELQKSLQTLRCDTCIGSWTKHPQMAVSEGQRWACDRREHCFSGIHRTFTKIYLHLGHSASLKTFQVWFHEHYIFSSTFKWVINHNDYLGERDIHLELIHIFSTNWWFKETMLKLQNILSSHIKTATS